MSTQPKSALMTLAEILKIRNLVLGDDVLKHMECEYNDIMQRNIRRGPEFGAGLVNSAIVHGMIGGNVTLYTLLDGTVLVIDARSRLKAFFDIFNGSVIVDLTKLLNGAIKWTTEKGVNLLSEKAYFSEYPDDIQTKVKGIELQVHIYDERFTSRAKMRDLFCALNIGVQKMNSNQINKNMYYGDLLQLIYELTQSSSLTEFISDADQKNDAATGLIGQLVAINMTGSHSSDISIRTLLKGHRHLSAAEKEEIKAVADKTGQLLSTVVDSNNKTFRKPANLCVLSYVLNKFSKLGILDKNLGKIKKGIEKLTADIRAYEGVAIGSHKLPAKTLADLNTWHCNGSALRSPSIKDARSDILCNYISSCLNQHDAALIPRDLKRV